MVEAIHWLQGSGVYFVRTSKHQLKIGDLNFWPVKGTLMFDGRARETVKGIKGLAELLSKRSRRGGRYKIL
jgi:hypothetical protein